MELGCGGRKHQQLPLCSDPLRAAPRACTALELPVPRAGAVWELCLPGHGLTLSLLCTRREQPRLWGEQSQGWWHSTARPSHPAGHSTGQAWGARGLCGGTVQCRVLELQGLPKTAAWSRDLRTSYISSRHRACPAMGQGPLH